MNGLVCWGRMYTRAIGGFVLLFVLVGCSSERMLVAMVKQEEQAEILAALTRNNIPVQPLAPNKAGLVQLTVDAELLPRAQAVLRDLGLPRRNFESFGTLFRKEGMVSSPFDERVRYAFAHAQELEHVISRMEGVIFVRVVLTSNDIEGIQRERSLVPSTAAVYIKLSPSSDLPNRLSELRQLIAHGIPNADEDRVSVYLDVVRAQSASLATNDSNAADQAILSNVWMIAGAALLLLASLVVTVGATKMWLLRRNTV